MLPALSFLTSIIMHYWTTKVKRKIKKYFLIYLLTCAAHGSIIILSERRGGKDDRKRKGQKGITMKKKINPLNTLKGEEGLETRNAAIVYLYNVREYTVESLAELTTLAKSTIKNYLRKFANLLDWAKEIFVKGKNIISEKQEEFWCYIDQITLSDGTQWCKIGQTTQTPEKRASGFSWVINGKKEKPLSVSVRHAIKCKDATAMQNMEDCLRIGMTSIDPDGYIKNDRLNSWQDDYPQRILDNSFVKMGLAQFTA